MSVTEAVPCKAGRALTAIREARRRIVGLLRIYMFIKCVEVE